MLSSSTTQSQGVDAVKITNLANVKFRTATHSMTTSLNTPPTTTSIFMNFTTRHGNNTDAKPESRAPIIQPVNSTQTLKHQPLITPSDCGSQHHPHQEPAPTHRLYPPDLDLNQMHPNYMSTPFVLILIVVLSEIKKIYNLSWGVLLFV